MKTKVDTFRNRWALLFHFMKGSKRLFAAGIAFSALTTLFNLVNPKIIAFTVDSVLGDKPARAPGFILRLLSRVGGVGFLRENLWAVALAVVTLAALSAATSYGRSLFNSMAAERLVERIRNLLFEHIVRLPFSWHVQNRTGDILQRCTSDVDTVKRFVAEQTTDLFRVMLLLTLSLVFLFRINVRLTLVAAGFIPVIVAYSTFFHGLIRKRFLAADEKEGEVSALVQENLSGARIVRAFWQEAREKERFARASGDCCELWVRFARLIGGFWCVGDMISCLQVLVVVTLGAATAVHGHMTAGDYIAFVAYNAMLAWPVRSLGRVISGMSKAGVSVDRLLYIMKAPVERDRDGALEPPIDRDIEFSHVSFSYTPGGPKALDNVSFSIPAGSTFGILGGAGSGKSTLLLLLARLYDLPPDGGRITVGGVDLADMRASWVRRNVGLVLQEPYLFSRTLKENIALALESAGQTNKRPNEQTTKRPNEHTNKRTNDQTIAAAAHAACLDEAVARFADGYDTFVGERGVTLSGGQRQRAAIAQMLVRHTPVMAFDDSLSSVDAETDAKIRQSLFASRRGATVIFVSHRIQTLMRCDRILVLDQGRVAELGTHEELLAKGGIYRRIHDIQMNPEGREDGHVR
ncbi:MAG: ABC transporter ATP-binding protein [Kiritimatiellae bacterium]|nr:ABC transporter ATP-binding protein [Kiritimatiellia bacterium]